MGYYSAKKVSTAFDTVIDQVKEGLKQQGFGVLTEIDVKGTFKAKLDVDFRKYRILGACNPGFAHKALQSESHIGVMLPCNVVVQETDDGMVDVAVIDPLASMMAIDNAALGDIATEVKSRLEAVLDVL